MSARSLQTACILLSRIGPAICLGKTPLTPAQADTVVFSHANVVSMTADGILADQTVTVQGGKILRVAFDSD
jgi:hypothetical protein